MRPPLHALQGFVATARLGNLSRAAESGGGDEALEGVQRWAHRVSPT